MKKIKKMIMMVVAVIFALLVTGCTDQFEEFEGNKIKDELVGTWRSGGSRYTFYKDGTYEPHNGDNGKWKLNGLVLYLSYTYGKTEYKESHTISIHRYDDSTIVLKLSGFSNPLYKDSYK